MRPRGGTILVKALRDRRRGLIGWSIGLLVMVVYVGSVFPSFRGNTSFDELLKNYPEAFRNMFGLGAGDLLTSGTGYLQAEFFSLMLPVIFLVFGIGSGARAIAGEEDDRTIDLLLATPVSRRRVVVEKAGAYLVATTVLATVAAIALLAVDAVFSMGVGARNLVIGIVAVQLLAVQFAAIALAAGAISGRRSIAIGAASAFAVATFLWNGLAPLTPALAGTEWISPWHHALGNALLREGLPLGSALVLVGTALLWFGVAVVAFDRRDLRS